MIVKLPRGRDKCALDLRGLQVRPLAPSAPPGAADCAALVAEAVDTPLSGPALVDRCAGARTVVLVVPDATRPAQLPDVLPTLVDRVRAGGVAESGIVVLVATGTHPRAAAAELEAHLGPLPSGIRVVEHDSRDAGWLIPVGSLDDGLTVRLARVLAEADVVLTVGAVRHHYFAGFGGGPKMVFPGVAGYEEIQRNHSRVAQVVGDTLRRHPRCEPGVLAGNPVAEEIAAATELAPPDMALCLVPGSDGRMAWAGAGEWRAAFEAAVSRAREWFEVDGGAPKRLLVLSGGGHPADATLIQAHKALDAGCRFLADGGEALFVADLGQGLGARDMEPFVADPDPQRILGRLAEGWIQYGHTTLRLLEKTGRCRVHLYSRLEPELAARLGMESVTDPADVIERWREEYPREVVALMAGEAVYPRGPGP